MSLAVELEIASPRVLVLDMETSPNLAEVWGLWNQNVSLAQLRESQRMICWGATWARNSPDEPQSPIMFSSEFHHGREVMLATLWALLDEATHVVGWNSKRFDVPHAMREFVAAGLLPPRPHQDIDLMTVVKKRFRFPSNKLAYVAKTLGVTQKLSAGGHETWTRCLAGDAQAWDDMKAYQIGDIRTTNELYERLWPWLPNRPNYGALNPGMRCPDCGSTEVYPDGHTHTAIGTYPMYRCALCGGLSKHKSSSHIADLRPM